MYHIMILDDEPNIVDSLYTMLTECFKELVVVYPSYLPKDALETMRHRSIDILIMDIRMPGINGIDMLGRVAKVCPSCKIILLSGYSDFEYAQSAMRYHGCVGYVLKSQGDEVLLAEIQRVMGEIDGEMHRDDEMLPCAGGGALGKYKSVADQCCQGYASLDSGDQLMRFVLTYVERHIGDSDLSLTKLAMETNYNPVYLSRVIKQKSGKGLLEIINDRRVERAKELLLEGKMSIQEIAQQVGFQSASYFTVLFRKKMGMNPSAFLHMSDAEKR